MLSFWNYCLSLFSVYIVIGLYLPNRTIGQVLTILEIDTSKFPVMRARFLAHDSLAIPIYPLMPSDFIIEENNETCKVLSLNCPAPKTQPLSAVLSIDVSASMAADRIEMARMAANTFVNLLPTEHSQCAITSFNHTNTLNQDFTADKNLLLSALARLSPRGGTDYNTALLNNLTGAFAIARRGMNKKVVILFTDGISNLNETEAIQQAKQSGIIFYCITSTINIPASLKSLANKTGGLWFEQINKPEQAIEAFKQILLHAQLGAYYEITWQSEAGCSSERELEFILPMKNIVGSSHYSVPKRGQIRLETSLQQIIFQNILPGSYSDTTISISAVGGTVTVVSLGTDNPAFGLKLLPSSSSGITPELPLIIKEGQSYKLNIHYTRPDSTQQVGRISFKTIPCGEYTIFIRGSLSGKRRNMPIKLVKPNGGEELIAGGDTVVQWTGVLPSDSVRVELSTDGGKTWQSISKKLLTGCEARWRAPAIQTKNALMRVQIARRDRPGMNPKKEKSYWKMDLSNLFEKEVLLNIIPSPSANKLLVITNQSAGLISTGKIPEAGQKQARKLEKIKVPNIVNAVFLPDGSQIRALTDELKQEGLAILHINTITGSLTESIKLGSAPAAEASYFSSDGKILALCTRAGPVYIYDTESGRELSILNGLAAAPESMDFSSDREWAVAVDSRVGKNVLIWKVQTGEVFQTLRAPESPIISGINIGLATAATFLPDNQRLAIVVLANDSLQTTNRVMLFDYKTNQLISEQQFQSNNGFIKTIKSNPDGTQLLIGNAYMNISNDKLETVRNAVGGLTTGNLIYIDNGERLFYRNRQEVACYPAPETGEIILGLDQSDAPFSIIEARFTAKDLDLGNVLVNSIIDTIFTEVLNNQSPFPIEIVDIEITGPDSAAFSVVSDRSFVLWPADRAGNERNVEIRFKPQRAGTHHATLQFDFGAGKAVRAHLKAEGIKRPVRLQLDKVDFGGVRVGGRYDSLLYGVLINENKETVKISRIEIWPVQDDTTGAFELLDSDKILELKSNESRNLKVRFSPKTPGKFQARIVVYIAGYAQGLTLPLYGMGLSNPPTVILSAFGVDANGEAKPLQKIKVQNFPVRMQLPLLNYIFFEHNSTELPLRYVRTKHFTNSLEKNQHPLSAYYNILNIIGKRLREKNTATLRILGCNDSASESANIALSLQRAETVRDYLIKEWQIEADRLIVASQNNPSVPATAKGEEGRAENRRVELLADDPAILAPVEIADFFSRISPATIRFKCDAQSDVPITDWKINVFRNGSLRHTFTGTGNLPLYIDWQLPKNAGSLLTQKTKVEFNAMVCNKYHDCKSTLPQTIPVEVEMYNQNEQANGAAVKIERYGLILFDFNRSDLTPAQQALIEQIRAKIGANATIRVRGYTDRIGEAAANEKLAAERAGSVAQALNFAQIQTEGIGEKELLYANDLPEGRFYCRTVIIEVETAP